MDDPKSNLPEKERGECFIIDGDLDIIEPCMFEIGVCFSVFYCLCYVKDTSIDMLEEQLLEERDPDLNVEEDIRM